MQSTGSGSRFVPCVLLGMGFLSISGCGIFQHETLVSDISYREQAAEIQKLVPFGSSRATTVKILQSSGVEGDYRSADNSIYYCQLWKRKDRKRWAMNVALLFDEQDRFYAVQPTDAAASIIHGPSTTPPAENKVDDNASGPQYVIPFPPTSQPTTEAPTARTPDFPGNRTPFGNSKN